MQALRTSSRATRLAYLPSPTAAAFRRQPADGPLALPTAREIRLTFVAEGREQAGYFYDERARHGVPVTLDVRADAQGEEELLIAPEGVTPGPRVLLSACHRTGVAPPAERFAARSHSITTG